MAASPAGAVELLDVGLYAPLEALTKADVVVYEPCAGNFWAIQGRAVHRCRGFLPGSHPPATWTFDGPAEVQLVELVPCADGSAYVLYTDYVYQTRLVRIAEEQGQPTLRTTHSVPLHPIIQASSCLYGRHGEHIVVTGVPEGKRVWCIYDSALREIWAGEENESWNTGNADPQLLVTLYHGPRDGVLFVRGINRATVAIELPALNDLSAQPRITPCAVPERASVLHADSKNTLVSRVDRFNDRMPLSIYLNGARRADWRPANDARSSLSIVWQTWIAPGFLLVARQSVYDTEQYTRTVTMLLVSPVSWTRLVHALLPAAFRGRVRALVGLREHAAAQSATDDRGNERGTSVPTSRNDYESSLHYWAVLPLELVELLVAVMWDTTQVGHVVGD